MSNRWAYCKVCKTSHEFKELSDVNGRLLFNAECLKIPITYNELDNDFINLRKDPEYATKGRSYTSKSEENMQKTPETGALKFDTDKPRMELLDVYAMEQIALVMTFGAKKYADENWRQGFKWKRLIGAALRHLMAFARGEDKDPESGLSHLAHAGCCIMFLLYHEKAHQALDDRFKYEVK